MALAGGTAGVNGGTGTEAVAGLGLAAGVREVAVGAEEGGQ